jgi:hypothetical protein
MTDETLDSDFWGSNRPARPSNGGEVGVGGPPARDPFGGAVIQGGDQIVPRPGGMPGLGIFPVDKDPSPRDR